MSGEDLYNEYARLHYLRGSLVDAWDELDDMEKDIWDELANQMKPS